MVKLFSNFALLLIWVCNFTPAHAQSGFVASSWPGPRHDKQLTGRATVLGPNNPVLQWTLPFGSDQLIAPTIAADGTIYVPGNVNDTLYAVSPAGHLRWAFTGKKLAQEEFVAPVVVARDSVIYFGSTQNIFYAVNPNGTLRWSLKLDGQVRYAANLGDDGVIYVAAKDCRLYAITPGGKIKWRVDLSAYPGNGPALSTDGTIYVVAGEWLQGFAPDGTRRLKVNCADLGILTGLVVDGFELIYVTGNVPRVRAISNSAATRWEYNFPASFGAPRLPALGKDHSLYFVSDTSGEIVVLNPNGTKRWSAAPATRKFLTELILDEADQLYVVDDNNGLMSMSTTGLMRWNLREVHCQFTPALGRDGTIYVASNKKLYAISARAPKLTVDTAKLDWGQVCVGTVTSRQFSISNTGNADLQVNNIFVSPVSFQVEPANFILTPGGRQTVTVKFLPAELADYAGMLTINSDAGNATLPLQGAGIGAKIAAVSAALQFGDVALGKSTTHLAQIMAAGTCEVRIDSVKVGGAYSVLPGSFPKTLNAGDTAKFTIRFLPVVLGAQTATLLIYNNDQQHNPLAIALNGNSVSTRPEIEVTPLALEFGKTCQATQKYALIANLGDQLLRVDSLSFSSAVFKTAHATKFTVAAGKQDTIRIDFIPGNGVESNGTLTIFSNDADEKAVAVKLHGAGGIPDIAGLPAIDFGTVELQTCAGLTNASSRTYVIRNDGSCILKIDSLVSGGAFSVIAPRVKEIPAGGSMNLALNFTPKITGEQSGRLRIVSNDPDERARIVDLHGRSTAAPDIAITGDTLDFGVVPVDTSKLLLVKIRNVGELNLAVTAFVVSSPRFKVAARQLALTCKQDSAVAITFTPDSAGVFTGTLSIRSNDPDEAAVKVLLRGVGTQTALPSIIAAAEYRFPALCVGSRDSLRAVITNTGGASLRVDSLRMQNGRQIFSLPVAGFSLQPQQSKTLFVSFHPTRPVEYTATVQVFSNASNHRVFTFGLRGTGSGPAISGPSTLVFAATKVDSIRREVYPVNNLGDCPLTISRVSLEGEQAREFKIVDVGDAEIAPHGSSRLVVEFKPNVASARLAKLVIENTDFAHPRFEIALNGSGSGAPGKLTGTTAINFGEACFEENVARACSLRNAGDTDVKILRLATARGELFKLAESPALPKILHRQETVAIPLTFSPKTPGAFNDTLLVQTDLAVGSWWRVPLQGTGRQDMTRLGFSHQTFAFNGHLDESKTELMTITNTGCGRLEINQIELARKLRVFAIRPEMPLPVKLQPLQSLKVQVSFKGDDFRAFADSLYIYCMDGQQKRERLSVSLSGNVTEGLPCLQFALSRLDFGEVPVGQIKRLDLEVTNCSSDSRVVVRAIQPVSGDFKVLPDTLTIFPRNAQFFAINFIPRQSGETSDTLKLIYHSISEPSQLQTAKIVLRGAATGNRAFALPNAFTPNGDGKNDAAKIHFSGYDATALVLRVFDLRGLEVRLLRPDRRGEFEINWDGRDDRGALQMPGAYLWLLENDGKKVGSGQLVLIR